MKYFDYAATTPPFEEVITTVAEVMRRHYGNPSSMHRYGEDADKLLKRSREVCAAALGVYPSEIVFTSEQRKATILLLREQLCSIRPEASILLLYQQSTRLCTKLADN